MEEREISVSRRQRYWSRSKIYASWSLTRWALVLFSSPRLLAFQWCIVLPPTTTETQFDATREELNIEITCATPHMPRVFYETTHRVRALSVRETNFAINKIFRWHTIFSFSVCLSFQICIHMFHVNTLRTDDEISRVSHFSVSETAAGAALTKRLARDNDF